MPLITDFSIYQIYKPLESKSETKINKTLAYVAPEIFTDNKYSMKSDVYSFGMIMFQIITGITPYKEIINFEGFEREDFIEGVVKGLRPPFTVPIKETLKKLFLSNFLKLNS